MPVFSSEFARDADRAREILRIFARHGFSLRSGSNADLDVAEDAVGDGPLTGTTGQRLCAAFTELGTTWIKLGQSMSMRADLVGADVAHDLEGLQAEVPSDQPGVARARVERELGKPVDELFRSFSDEPFASGSVAQAHRAVLLDGTEAVVKVLHDGAAERVASDLGLMRRLAVFADRVDPDVARFGPVAIVDQFSAMMRQATDLRNELRNMQRLTVALADLEWLIVPRPHPELSSAGVLTMEFMPGAPLRGASDIEAGGWAVDDLNSKVTYAWLTMIFSNGFYHADPHPGNFLIADPDHLVLLDFGDVGFLSGPRRDDVARLLLALTSHDVPAFTDVILDVCAPRGPIDSDALEGAVDVWLATYLPEDAGSAERDLNAATSAGLQLLHDFGLTFPPELAMVVRVMVRLEGFGKQIGNTVSVDDQLGPFIRQFMADESSPEKLAKRAVRTVMAWRQLARDLPRDLSSVMTQLRTGEARFEVNLHDPDEIADKVVDGLVASAALLGAAQLLSRGTPPQVKGVSVLGVVGAGLAAVTLRRLSAARKGHQALDQKVVALVKRARH